MSHSRDSNEYYFLIGFVQIWVIFLARDSYWSAHSRWIMRMCCNRVIARLFELEDSFLDCNRRSIILKSRKDYTKVDWKRIEKKYKENKILACGIKLDKCNQVFAYEFAKELWENLYNTTERTCQLKQSNINILTTQYDLFKMSKGNPSKTWTLNLYLLRINSTVSEKISVPTSWSRRFWVSYHLMKKQSGLHFSD